MKLLLIVLVLFSTPSLANEPPLRIVSAGASVTEILFALERGNLVIATDNTSLYPEKAAALPKLGYFRQLSSEGVLAQMPSHLFGAAATGPKSMIEQLKAAHVTVNIFTQNRDMDGLYAMISAIADKVNASDQGKALNRRIKKRIATLKEQANHQGIEGVKALYIVANTDRGLTVAGNHTLPDALFTELALENIAHSLDNFKVMNNEQIMLANPDIIFVASHLLAGATAKQDLCGHGAIKQTYAGKHCLVEALDSATSLGLSPRIPDTLQRILSLAVQVTKD
ncbi:ABC transporter substrate-binding protein [Alteromonas sp. C1M14]|uniref:heme/hemin ABC transporter substrate-binding protein n=1 Tax=Alteromonas sp. C1M14 TaxID=2841567 RepID=UPI001C080B08|nr:ABC transporter substrate-binding protein [Alteromonas sp. C1M14]MBU2979793.1 ABC transporter substrate-binding protein [Alteromonas sp. C1M14]